MILLLLLFAVNHLALYPSFWIFPVRPMSITLWVLMPFSFSFLYCSAIPKITLKLRINFCLVLANITKFFFFFFFFFLFLQRYFLTQGSFTYASPLLLNCFAFPVTRFNDLFHNKGLIRLYLRFATLVSNFLLYLL